MFAGAASIIFMILGCFTNGMNGYLCFVAAGLFYIAFTIDQKGESK